LCRENLIAFLRGVARRWRTIDGIFTLRLGVRMY
jgi:hypothetical protein